MIGNLLDGVKITLAKAAQGSDTSDVVSDLVDMRGYSGVVFLGTIASENEGNYLKVQQGDESDGSDMTDLEDTSVVADGNGGVVASDVYRPTKRYVRGVIVRGSATATGAIYALRHQPSSVPVTNAVSGEVAVAKTQSPAEATG